MELSAILICLTSPLHTIIMSLHDWHSSEIRTYSLTSHTASSVVTRCLDCLRPHLPTCLPLYRRIQFGRFFDDTCLLTNIDCTNTASEAQSSERSDDSKEIPPWFVAFVDRSCRPETEVWFFGSWESSPPAPSAAKAWAEIDSLVLQLVKTAKDLPIPASIHQDVLDAQAAKLNDSDERDTGGLSRADYGSHASNPDVMLWGSIHERTVPVLQRLGALSLEYKTTLVRNHTFVFSIAGLRPPAPLPDGLEWGEVRAEHFSLIRSRTQIPRQDRTMAVLPSLAIYPTAAAAVASNSAPIAWAFVGLDASVTTLHVEPEWRGRGLAKVLMMKLLQEKTVQFHEPGLEKLGHAVVIVGNTASERVCKSVGGVSEWECYWLRVDLGKV